MLTGVIDSFDKYFLSKQADFLKSAWKTGKVIWGDIAEDDNLMFYTTDGYVAHTMLKSSCAINFSAFCPKNSRPLSANFDSANLKDADFAGITADGNTVIKSYDGEVTAYFNSKLFKEFEKKEFTFKLLSPLHPMCIYRNGFLVAILMPVSPRTVRQ